MEVSLRNAMRAYIASPALSVVQVTSPDQSSTTYRSMDELRRLWQWAASMATQERAQGRTLFLGMVPHE